MTRKLVEDESGASTELGYIFTFMLGVLFLALVEVSILLGEVLQDSGRIEEALERYREALIISEANDLRMQIGELLARLGGVAPDRQRRMEYLQRALSVFRELGAQTRMREVQMMVHTAVMGR